MAKINDREFQRQHEKNNSSNTKSRPPKAMANFSSEILWARRKCHNISQVLKMEKKKPKTNDIFPAKISLRIKREIKCSQDKQKIKEFVTTKPAS